MTAEELAREIVEIFNVNQSSFTFGWFYVDAVTKRLRTHLSAAPELLTRIRDEIITDEATSAADYPYAEEKADPIIRAATQGHGENSQDKPIPSSDVEALTPTYEAERAAGEKWLRDNGYYDDKTVINHAVNASKGFKAGWQARAELGERRGWIPVSEKPMPFDETVLARIAYNSLRQPCTETIVCYAEECFDTRGNDVSELFAENGDDIGWTKEVVTHWMPLPTPPREGEKETRK